MNENLLKRQEMRQTLIDMKKKEKDMNGIESENSDYIMKEINDIKVNIESQLESLVSCDANKLKTQLQEMNEQYDKLKKLINDSTLYLAKYNLKSAQIILNSIRNKIDSKKDLLIPKSTFSFKKPYVSDSSNKMNVSLETNINAVDVTDSAVKKIFDPNSIPFCGFKNITKCKQILKLLSEQSNGNEVELSNLVDCSIEIYGTPNTLKIDKLLNCKLFCGPITTSAFIADCHNCVLNIACQQLRVHTSTDCDILLHVSSRAIIEDSTRLRFGPYNWSYRTIDEDFKNANLDPSLNNWKEIDDFDCLTPNKRSYNWSFIS